MFDKQKENQVRIQLMVLESDKEAIQAAAREAGVTMSEYIRTAIKFYYESNHE